MQKLKNEKEYMELCALMGKPLGIPKMWICDILYAAAFQEIVIAPVLLGKYYKERFGWDWEQDDRWSLEDYTRLKFGNRAVELIKGMGCKFPAD